MSIGKALAQNNKYRKTILVIHVSREFNWHRIGDGFCRHVKIPEL